MGLLGDAFSVAGAIAGKKAGKKANAAAAADYAQQKNYASQQVDFAKLIKQLTEQLMGQSSSSSDAYGSGTVYNPVTGKWETVLGTTPAGIQDAADTEELNRYTLDQTARREGLRDVEARRARASGEANTALLDLNNFKSGIGAVDGGGLANQLRLNRSSAVNAGYDDAAKAARTISLRTGAGAGDALAGIGRARANSIATSMGDPEIEAMTLASGENSKRQGNLAGMYDLFSKQANNVYDSGFAPADYASKSADRGMQTQQLDLSRLATAMEGAGSGAATIGSAARGLREASGARTSGTDYNLNGKLLQGLGNSADSMAKNLAKMFSGGFGG